MGGPHNHSCSWRDPCSWHGNSHLRCWWCCEHRPFSACIPKMKPTHLEKGHACSFLGWQYCCHSSQSCVGCFCHFGTSSWAWRVCCGPCGHVCPVPWPEVSILSYTMACWHSWSLGSVVRMHQSPCC